MPGTSARYSPERASFLADLFTTFFEDGGLNSWRHVINYKWNELAHEDYHGVIIEIGDGEIEVRHEITIATFQVGIQKICGDPNFNLQSSMRENICTAHREDDAGAVDAYDVDMIGQAALFGKIIYG